ncbi:MAG: winged helix-turn-helix transcriptional regulator [Anaerolineales bacterium]|nr:winged helix-turn-helix transcriptional regulator [Anaerolineales bacterium]MCW5854878.1 winged helix-turn-helix transcriptional regulator [Anaerolineales bacterium]
MSSPFQAISDPTRRQILDALRAEGPQRAGDLAARFPAISRPGVSKHLRVLRQARLLHQERRGRELWYQLDAGPLSQVEAWLEQYAAFWEEKLRDLKKAAEGE